MPMMAALVSRLIRVMMEFWMIVTSVPSSDWRSCTNTSTILGRFLMCWSLHRMGRSLIACNIETATRRVHFPVNDAINILAFFPTLPSIIPTHLFPDVNVAVLAEVEHRVNALVHLGGEVAEESRNKLGTESLTIVRTLDAS